MHFVKESMHDWSQQHSGDDNEHQARVERIEARENLSRWTLYVANEPHAAEKH